MVPSDVFAKRLRNARIMKGFSMDELVQAIGKTVTKMSISKYENCQLKPTSTVVLALSEALEQPVDYFFRPFDFQLDSIRFRKTKSGLSVKQENSIKEKVFDLVERYMEIEEICNASIGFKNTPKTPVSCCAEAKSAARVIRKAWELGSDGIVNVVDLLERHGVKVLEIDAPDHFDGLSSLVNGEYPVIVLNSALPSERKRFTALHELGHLVMDFGRSEEEKDEEKMCHCFADEMLIPDSVLKMELNDARQNISYQELKDLQMRFGISCDAIMFKAKSCRIISEQRHRQFFIKKSKSPAFKQMVEKSLYPQEYSCRFQCLVYKALSSDLVSISKAASLLRQNVEQVRGEFALV